MGFWIPVGLMVGGIFYTKYMYCLGMSLHTVKGKSVPLQAQGAQRVPGSYYVTVAQNGGKVVSLTHRPPLPPGNTPGTHFC